MHAPIFVSSPNSEDADLDLFFLAPEGMGITQAEGKAAEVHKAYHAALTGEPDREAFIAAMAKAGFAYPDWAQAPDWNQSPAGPRRRR